MSEGSPKTSELSAVFGNPVNLTSLGGFLYCDCCIYVSSPNNFTFSYTI